MNFFGKIISLRRSLRFPKNPVGRFFYRRGGKSLLYLNLKEGGFTATVVIGMSLADKIKKAKLSPETKKMFANAKQFYDGKWLNFDIENECQIEDIKTLLLIKKNPIKIV